MIMNLRWVPMPKVTYCLLCLLLVLYIHHSQHTCRSTHAHKHSSISIDKCTPERERQSTMVLVYLMQCSLLVYSLLGEHVS